jgi:hypothetical protein
MANVEKYFNVSGFLFRISLYGIVKSAKKTAAPASF